MANEKLQDQSKYRWDLSVLYKEGLEDPAWWQDQETLAALLRETEAQIKAVNEDSSEEVLAQSIRFAEQFYELVSRMAAFLSLSRSADTTNTAYPAALNQLMMQLSPLQVLQVAVAERLEATEDLDGLIERQGLADYSFNLHEMKEQAAFRLSQDLEAMLAKVSISGASAWGNMASFLSATLEVDWEGQKVTLSDIRNLAYSEDPDVRRRAYEAELAAYPKIAEAMAFALHSIKSYVNLTARERGYASALDEALFSSRLSRKSLDAMLEVMQESFPLFRRYFKYKARLLGHEDKLPFYDLFAPVGKLKGGYSIEEGQALLLESFSELSPEIAGLMKRAFAERWIDYLPRPGKVGGAFCANLPEIGQSRILSNYDGSFNAIDTLAHELGHAYHGFCIEDHKPLNRSYSMPVAETASTFNETHLTTWALERSRDPEEELALLEQFISGAAQTIVDISSRYFFEKEVFERCDKEFLDSKALQDIMFRAQQQTYGEAMPDDCRHPFMWVCKSHYYSHGLSYYNFPYAFGQLFSMSLYSMFKEEGAPFMEKYKELLHETTVASCEDVALKVGADLKDKAFWRKGMAAFADMIERYCALAEAKLH